MKTLVVATMAVLGWGTLAMANVPIASQNSEQLEIAQVSAKEYSIRGFLKAERGDHAGAIADFTRSLELEPRDADVYYNRAISRSALGDATGAIADLTQSIQLAPGNGDAYFNRGLLWASTGNQAQAIADYNAAIDIYEVRAMIMLLLGDSPRLIVHPSLTYLYYHRGLARYNLGDRALALRDFQQASTFALATGNQQFYQYLLTTIHQLR